MSGISRSPAFRLVVEEKRWCGDKELPHGVSVSASEHCRVASKLSSPDSTVTRGLATMLWNQAGDELPEVRREEDELVAVVVVAERGRPESTGSATVVTDEQEGTPSSGPSTAPLVARNSLIISALKLLMSVGAPGHCSLLPRRAGEVLKKCNRG